MVVKGDGERGLENYSLVSGLSKQLGSRGWGSGGKTRCREWWGRQAQSSYLDILGLRCS